MFQDTGYEKCKVMFEDQDCVEGRKRLETQFGHLGNQQILCDSPNLPQMA